MGGGVVGGGVVGGRVVGGRVVGDGVVVTVTLEMERQYRWISKVCNYSTIAEFISVQLELYTCIQYKWYLHIELN